MDGNTLWIFGKFQNTLKYITVAICENIFCLFDHLYVNLIVKTINSYMSLLLIYIFTLISESQKKKVLGYLKNLEQWQIICNLKEEELDAKKS